MPLIDVENALEMMTVLYKSNTFDCTYAIREKDADMVQIEVTKDNIPIMTWFDSKKQVFGFQLLNFITNEYKDFGEFVTYLCVYAIFLLDSDKLVKEYEKFAKTQLTYPKYCRNQLRPHIDGIP